MNGIYYANGGRLILVDSGDVSFEDRCFFTHIEFWDQETQLLQVEIGRCSHAFLVGLSANPNWPQLIKNGLLN